MHVPRVPLHLALQAGDFEELYSNSYGNSYSNSSTAPPWDALVTSYQYIMHSLVSATPA